MGRYLRDPQAWTSKGACPIATTGRCELSLENCSGGSVRPELGPQVGSLPLQHGMGMSGREVPVLGKLGMSVIAMQAWMFGISAQAGPSTFMTQITCACGSSWV